jgi:hypothetical protein
MKVGLILVMVAVLTLLGVGATAALAAPKDTQEVQGTIANISMTTTPKTVTITPKDGGTVTLQVPDGTLITKAGIGKATLGDLVVNDRIVATCTGSGASAVASKLSVSQPLAKNHAFVGYIANITINSPSTIKIITKKQVDVLITVNNETKYKVPGVKDATLSKNFKNGDEVAVLAVESMPGTYLALYVNLIPGKPVSVQRVGTISDYEAGVSIEITGKKGDVSTFNITSDTKILYKRGAKAGEEEGKQATVIASRDPATDQYTAKSILVFGSKGKP